MKKLIVVLAALAALVPAVAVAQSSRSTSGTAYASGTHTEGSDLYVSGDLKDKILGRGAIVYVVNVRPAADGAIAVNAKRITIYTKRGTLEGTGRATQTTQGENVTVTDGTFNLTKGTGGLRGRRMSGTFSGDLRNGVYKFTYKATLR